MPVDERRPEHQLDAGHDRGDRRAARPAARAWAIHVAPAAIFAAPATHEHRAEHDGGEPGDQVHGVSPRELDDRPSRAANTSTPIALPQAAAAAARRSIMSSSWLGSWWNSASRRAPTSPASHTAYSTVQWPQSHFVANSAGVYWASWISRSTPWHSSQHAVGDARPADAAAGGR